MAIYGQMTSRPGVGEGEEEEEEGGETRDKLKQVTVEATKDLEEVLSHLSESIDDLTTDRGPAHSATPPSTAEPSHLTLADSPTNFRGPTNQQSPRDHTIV